MANILILVEIKSTLAELLWNSIELGYKVLKAAK